MSAQSNREALRKLSSKFPPPPEVERIIKKNLRADKDISAAIVGTALVEAALEKLLIAKFKNRNANLIGQLFKNRGPLTDFHSKILIASAFGIITPNQAEELHSLKAIRNAFAHTKVEISFEHELVEIETKSLVMLQAIKRAQKSQSTNFL